MKPTVGRIVHFYAPDWADMQMPNGSAFPGYNGQGAGPYAAIITQAFEQDGNVSFCNLKVLVPFSFDGVQLDIGSVSEKGGKFYSEGNCFWEWPPRVD